MPLFCRLMTSSLVLVVKKSPLNEVKWLDCRLIVLKLGTESKAPFLMEEISLLDMSIILIFFKSWKTEVGRSWIRLPFKRIVVMFILENNPGEIFSKTFPWRSRISREGFWSKRPGGRNEIWFRDRFKNLSPLYPLKGSSEGVIWVNWFIAMLRIMSLGSNNLGTSSKSLNPTSNPRRLSAMPLNLAWVKTSILFPCKLSSRKFFIPSKTSSGRSWIKLKDNDNSSTSATVDNESAVILPIKL